MRTIALTALLLLQLTAYNQTVSSSVVNSTGNSYSQGYYSIDWSVGELAIVNTLQSSNQLLVISSGFLQPDLPQNNTAHHFGSEEIKILPNPTFGQLEINIATRQQGVMSIKLYDANGKLLKSGKLMSPGTGSIERMDLTMHPSGTYLVKIDLEPTVGSVRKTGTYKILKL